MIPATGSRGPPPSRALPSTWRRGSAGSCATGSDRAGPSPMAVEGTLDLFKLPEILQLVAQQKKTGILTVQGQQDIVAISFLNGRIVAADALNQTLEEGLSRVLASEGILSA